MFRPKEETMSTYKRFFGLFKQAKLQGNWPYEDHSELVAEFTGGQTTSLRKLTERELWKLEARLEEMIGDPKKQAGQRMRRKIIGILAGRGAVTTQGKPDMAHIYAWVLRYGYLKKDLNAYTVQELPKLVYQAESVLASDLKAILAHHG